MHFVVGTDGSEASKKAFELAVTFFKPGGKQESRHRLMWQWGFV